MKRWTNSLRRGALLTLAFSAMLSFSSCEKDTIDDPGLPGSGTLTAKVDGTDFDANVAVQASSSSGVLSIMGSNMVGKAINLTIFNYSGPDTYDMGGLGNTSSALWQETLTSEGGFSTFGTAAGISSVTIDTDDGSKVTGSFSFSGRNSNGDVRSVTDGSFEAPIQ
jgi:hypothetical protein